MRQSTIIITIIIIISFKVISENNYFTYFSIVVPSDISVFLSCRPFVVNTTFSTGLVGAEVYSVSWLGQLTDTGKKNTQMLDGMTVEK